MKYWTLCEPSIIIELISDLECMCFVLRLSVCLCAIHAKDFGDAILKCHTFSLHSNSTQVISYFHTYLNPLRKSIR